VDGVWDDQEDEVLQHALWSAGEAINTEPWEADTLLAAFEFVTALAIHSYRPAHHGRPYQVLLQAMFRCVCTRRSFSPAIDSLIRGLVFWWLGWAPQGCGCVTDAHHWAGSRTRAS
jgi:hypothetical protein